LPGVRHAVGGSEVARAGKPGIRPFASWYHLHDDVGPPGKLRDVNGGQNVLYAVAAAVTVDTLARRGQATP
jgi:hypothetical protein